MEELVSKIEEIIVRENTKLKNELRAEFKSENAKLKNELRQNLSDELKKEILDRMFVFEENYGRSINIMFEEIMSKNQKDRNMEKDIVILERRVDKNSAFIMSHENRIATLEEAKI